MLTQNRKGRLCGGKRHRVRNEGTVGCHMTRELSGEEVVMRELRCLAALPELAMRYAKEEMWGSSPGPQFTSREAAGEQG
jgi:hypothetical protein